MAQLPRAGGDADKTSPWTSKPLYSSRFWSKPARAAVLVVGQIKPQLEEALGRPMSLSSVYALLHLHNWRKLVPDKRHPQSDPVAQEEWKKNSSKHSKTPAKTG